jgi:enolase-phosphatase E1
LGQFLERHWDDPAVRADVTQLKAEHSVEAAQPAPPPWSDDPTAVTAYVHWLMDRDRKSTGLKSLQGKIWDEGYRAGELRGEVYPDVPPALERWTRQGIDVAIFSSGSVQAQRSLFQSTAAGDLTRFIRDYFDTTTGPKTAPGSYTRIAAALGRSPSEVLFLSDVGRELDAARAAGMQTALCVRKSGASVTGVHPVIHTFDRVPL